MRRPSGSVPIAHTFDLRQRTPSPFTHSLWVRNVTNWGNICGGGGCELHYSQYHNSLRPRSELATGIVCITFGAV